jgi:predicted nucleic acid-binding protein
LATTDGQSVHLRWDLYSSIDFATIIETKLAICAVFVPLTEEGAKIFGELKSKYQKHFGLKKKALSQNSIDMILASTAIEIGAILVSNDKIFEKIQEIQPDLQLENWTT